MIPNIICAPAVAEATEPADTAIPRIIMEKKT